MGDKSSISKEQEQEFLTCVREIEQEEDVEADKLEEILKNEEQIKRQEELYEQMYRLNLPGVLQMNEEFKNPCQFSILFVPKGMVEQLVMEAIYMTKGGIMPAIKTASKSKNVTFSPEAEADKKQKK